MSATGTEESTVTVLSGGRVFDGDRFSERTDVVFRGRTVVSVGPGLAAEHPDAVVFDCSGTTLFPGFVDAHVHIMSEGPGGPGAFRDPFSLAFYAAIDRLRRTLAAGVTTVREAGGADLGTKTAVENGLIPGPRMSISVAMMSQTGGHGDFWMPAGAVHPWGAAHPGRPSGIADGVDDVRRKARELLRAGADQLKICTTGGVMSTGDDPTHTQYSPAEIAAVVEEAAARGTYVMAHAQGSAGIKNALRAGVHSIEHGVYLDDEAIDLFLENDAVLVPTLVAPLAVIEDARRPGSGLPQAAIDKALRTVDIHRDSVSRAIAAGVTIAMGTDSGVGPHGRNLQELTELADLGMGFEQALRAATSVAGELIPGARVGRLAEGFLADAVVVEGSLEKASDLGRISGTIRQVWQNGALVHSA